MSYETLHTGSKIDAENRWDRIISQKFEKVPKIAIFRQNFGKNFTKTSNTPTQIAALLPNPK